MQLRRVRTVREDKVAEFDMVTFFKVPPPDKISDVVIKMPSPAEAPFYNTRTYYDGPPNFEQVPAKQYQFNRQVFKYSSAAYLFSGSLELYEVTDHGVLDDCDAAAKDGYRLKVCIRTFAGEPWGVVWYDYLYYNERVHSGVPGSPEAFEKRQVVDPLRNNGLFTTIEAVSKDKYILFVDHPQDSTKKVAIGMELYPADKERFEGAIAEYEQSLQSLERSRHATYTVERPLSGYDISSEDLPGALAETRSGTRSGTIWSSAFESPTPEDLDLASDTDDIDDTEDTPEPLERLDLDITAHG